MSSQGIEGWIFSRPYQKDSHGGDSLLFDVSLDGNLPFGNTDDSSYQHYELSIQPGDWLLLYTDALTEAFNDRDEQLGSNISTITIEVQSPESSCGKYACIRQHGRTNKRLGEDEG